MSDTAVIDGLYGDVIMVSMDHEGLYLTTQEDDTGSIADIFLDDDQALEVYNAIGERLGFDLPSSPLVSTPKWEEITVDPKGAGHTYRLSVPGGWLYRTVSYDMSLASHGDEYVVAQSPTFVPTPPVPETY